MVSHVVATEGWRQPVPEEGRGGLANKHHGQFGASERRGTEDVCVLSVEGHPLGKPS